MKTINPFFIDDSAEQAELYELYREFNERTREEIVARTLPGSYRERLLLQFRPLPREHFEAHLERLHAEPGRYAAAVTALRRGFDG